MNTLDLDATIVRIALANHHLITVDQARSAQVTRLDLARRAEAGLLERVDHGLYRLRGAPPNWDERALAACRSSGLDAILSHRAAAMIWGLDGFRAAPIELTTVRWTRRRGRSGVIVHESIDLPAMDRSTACGLPVTTVVRTLLDLPAVARLERVDEAWEDALRRDLCTVDQLLHRFVQRARRGRPGVRIGRALLERRTGDYVPTGSVLELKTATLLETLSVPSPARQHLVVLDDGTRVYLDFAWTNLKIALECDGMWDHGTNTQLPWDADRQNQLQLMGWLVLRISWKALVDEPDRISSEILRAYRSRERQLRAGTATW